MKYINFFDIKLISESIIHILIRARFKYCIYYYDLMYIIVLLVIMVLLYILILLLFIVVVQ